MVAALSHRAIRRPQEEELDNTKSSTNGTASKLFSQVGQSIIVADNDDDRDYHREHQIDDLSASSQSDDHKELHKPFKTSIVWRNVFAMSLLHVLGLWGWYYCARYGQYKTMFWAYAVGVMSGLGILAGAHRLWTHRSFKAHWSVRLMLMFLQTLALQVSVLK